MKRSRFGFFFAERSGIVGERSVDRKRDQWRRVDEESRPRLSAALLSGPKENEAREKGSNQSNDSQQNSWSREGLAVPRWMNLVSTLSVVGQSAWLLRKRKTRRRRW